MRLTYALIAAILLVPFAHAAEPPSDNVRFRGRLDNCRIRFEREKKGHVAFIGGSITEMNGYRPMVCEILNRRFPDTAFTFTDAGISSTCSTTGAFRLKTDVLDKGPVDLLFVEFAVNDDQDAAHARRDCIRGMEGIVRQALRHNPGVDIVITHFVNPEMITAIQEGRTPLTISAHEAVAERYGISTINLAREVAGRITAGTLTWEKYGGVHPAPAGNAICAGMIDQLFGMAWAKPLAADAAVAPHAIPDPIDANSYSFGRFIDPATLPAAAGWTLGVPPWKDLKGSKRERFMKVPLLCADQPGATITFPFEGTAIGAYVLAGPDAGIVEAIIDGGPPTEVDLLHHFSAGLHYPRTVMFAADLKPGRHTVALRISQKTQSAGHAARILQFTANTPPER